MADIVDVWTSILLPARSRLDQQAAEHFAHYNSPMTAMAKAHTWRSNARGEFALRAPEGFRLENERAEMGKVVIVDESDEMPYQLKSITALQLEIDNAGRQGRLFSPSESSRLVLYRFDKANNLHLSAAPARIVGRRGSRRRVELLEPPRKWGSWPVAGSTEPTDDRFEQPTDTYDDMFGVDEMTLSDDL